MRFSLRLNNDLAPAEYVALARAAEDAGFDQIWVSDDLFLRSAPVLLATMATSTRRIEVGSGILNPYTIHTSELAMLAATMDELSGNRFNLGLSVGAPDFLKWIGIRPARPLAVMRETIGAVRTLLRGESAALQGGFLEWTEEAYLRFAPPRLTPVYVGAMGPRMLALAGELADGVLPLLFPPGPGPPFPFDHDSRPARNANSQLKLLDWLHGCADCIRHSCGRCLGLLQPGDGRLLVFPGHRTPDWGCVPCISAGGRRGGHGRHY